MDAPEGVLLLDAGCPAAVACSAAWTCPGLLSALAGAELGAAFLGRNGGGGGAPWDSGTLTPLLTPLSASPANSCPGFAWLLHFFRSEGGSSLAAPPLPVRAPDRTARAMAVRARSRPEEEARGEARARCPW
ncbi:hypothetical protein NDU88_000847 [Pleurodeles waltl]|uniref:Uncharacterized protein n=1 Tax=Pleurodeles waltl TaxID=8319 RepID=A0AAV7L7R8_PLEWA|nr:hypothetical protein NDU88_000847 [Pleurodeles waltl]